MITNDSTVPVSHVCAQAAGVRLPDSEYFFGLLELFCRGRSVRCVLVKRGIGGQGLGGRGGMRGSRLGVGLVPGADVFFLAGVREAGGITQHD